MFARLSRIAANAKPGSSIVSRAGPQSIEAIVDRLYVGLGPGLHRAAGRSVHAHLLDLVARGLVASDGAPVIDAIYRKSGS